MNSRVTILICYQIGTRSILDVCLSSIKRHTREVAYALEIASELKNGETLDISLGDIDKLCGAEYYCGIAQLPAPEVKTISSSNVHGRLLDKMVGDITTEFILTMDSDCFPLADGWLSELLAMMDAGAGTAGILHPWSPPPLEMDPHLTAYRLRSQHCWETTHVACQMVRTSDLRQFKLKYAAGDDTGLEIPRILKMKGKNCAGFKPTRSPLPASGSVFDPEFNRYVCLVFGDKIYHQGGFTRTTSFGDEPLLENEFGWVRKKILQEGGAEWLLNDQNSYRFKFDREEEVFQEKFNRLFGMLGFIGQKPQLPPDPGYVPGRKKISAKTP